MALEIKSRLFQSFDWEARRLEADNRRYRQYLDKIAQSADQGEAARLAAEALGKAQQPDSDYRGVPAKSAKPDPIMERRSTIPQRRDILAVRFNPHGMNLLSKKLLQKAGSQRYIAINREYAKNVIEISFKGGPLPEGNTYPIKRGKNIAYFCCRAFIKDGALVNKRIEFKEVNGKLIANT